MRRRSARVDPRVIEDEGIAEKGFLLPNLQQRRKGLLRSFLHRVVRSMKFFHLHVVLSRHVQLNRAGILHAVCYSYVSL